MFVPKKKPETGVEAARETRRAAKKVAPKRLTPAR
jgi:hypothetical protein